MTVSTSSPVPADLTVAITVSDPSLASVGGGAAVIPAGQSSASFTLTGLSLGTVTVIASAGQSSVLDHVQVIVGPNLTCIGNQPTTATDPVVISGAVSVFVGSLNRLPNVEVKFRQLSDDTILATTTTDNNGNFSVSVTSEGLPVSGYLELTASGYTHARQYWSKPLTGPTSISPILYTPQSLASIYFDTVELTPQPNMATIVLSIADCSGSPVTGASAIVDPNTEFVIDAAAYGIPGSKWVLNQPAGMTAVSVNSGSTTFGTTQVTAASGDLILVSITP